MKKLFIIANWKSNETADEAMEWLHGITNFQFPISNEKEVIICPPFTSLSTVKAFLMDKQLPLKLGSQDISAFGAGAHTGEVNADQVKEFATHVIIGHSERRNELSETDELLAKKVEVALQDQITPIFCVQGVDTPIPQGVILVAYEPIFAIGTGHPDTPENAETVIKSIKEKTHVQFVLYGGSVTPDNVHSFTSMPSIDGVLVGGASLDPQKFIHIIENA